MLRYADYEVTFREVPNEVNLCINIVGCPHHCEGCHSPQLRSFNGKLLTINELSRLIESNEGITCVCLLGGDGDPNHINTLAKHSKSKHPSLKVCWYSGNNTISDKIDLSYFDFIKIGPYIEEKGPLTSLTTNQIFYAKGEHIYGTNKEEINPKAWYDVTYMFNGNTK